MSDETQQNQNNCHFGPASSSKTMMSKLISSGVDVFRINFSHAKHEDVERIVSDIKNLRIKHNKHVSILGDLQGPKIRLGMSTKTQT